MANKNRDVPFPQIIRDRMSAADALNNLKWVEKELRDRYRELDLGEIPALREYAKIQMFKLNKVVPDLKAIEHSGHLAIDTAIKITVSG
jgi:hypothetical protein